MQQKGYNDGVSANVNSIASKFKYNGKELDESFGLNMYDYHARMFDPALGRMMNIDPHADTYFGISPYNYAINNPALLIDPDGKDAIVTIKDGVITVTTNIYIYGSGASEDRASQIKSAIDSFWNDGENKYTDENGNEFDVVFDTNVKLYDEEDPTDTPILIPGAFNPNNTDNFIEVDDGNDRSYVKGGDEGVWYTKGAGKKDFQALLNTSTYAHEFGHLLGLADRYTNDSDGIAVPHAGYENQIMGTFFGEVDQRAINGVVKESVQKYNKFVKKYGDEQATKNVYTTKIDIARPKN